MELRSLQAVDVDIGGWRIEGGIDYTFPNGTAMPGLGHIVVAAIPGQIAGAYGPFTGQLDNGGETLRLVNRNGRVMDEVSYDDEGDWPLGADGSGATLTRRNPTAASGPTEWTTSKNIGGTPGAKNYAEPSDPPVVTTLIPLNATWKYKDDNVGQPAGWNGSAFDDSSWASGGALLYAGSPNITGAGEGLHGYWPLDETTGTTAANLASGGTTGSLVNGPAWVTDGTRGKVLSFDGVDDYVNAGLLPQMTLSNNFTWSFWTFSTQTGGNVILGNRYSPSGGDWSPREFIKFTSDAFQYDTNNVLFVDYVNIPTSTWVHHAMVKQGTQLTYYRNGVATNSASISAGQNNAQPFYFGGDKAGERWSGRLDDIAVWTKALPPSSVASLANGTVTPLTAPTGSSGSTLTTSVLQGPMTHYFRKSFTFSGAKERTTLTLQHMLDDGAVVYLNGTEVLRANMGGGEVTHATPALTDVTSTGLSASLPIPTDSLVNGTNVLAVEVHQHPNNSDMVFGVNLVASEAPDLGTTAATLVFSEISGAADPDFFIELQNQSGAAVNSSGWTITTSNGDSFALPSGTINGGGFLSFTAASIGLTPADGMRLYLFAPGGTNLRDARAITNRIRGLGSDGRWAHPTASTPGAANVVTVSTDIVINEIFYHGLNGSPEQWIELHNRSAAPVDVSGWKLTDGVNFDIPANTTVAAGGFLVIAWDPAAFATLHPGVTALGPWSGSLSNSGEQITLRDASDNVADQLTYADGGLWSSWADGGGSSLELRDPRADNSKGEAWDASDESSKSSWVTIASGTYQGTGVNSNASDPANYNEFVFGLLDAGEFLIDDISVKDVSIGNAELIQNGSFEGGTPAAWRIIGTHSGTVINDPTSGSGKVLKVVATGATEHMHNHAETTLKVGSSYVNLDATHTYNITFRAKWLRGSNRLHTRLWHNRLPRQTLLNVPTTGGTPGAPNGKAVANIGPTFDTLAVAPVVPAAAQPATVTIRVADPDNVTNVQLFTSVNGAPFASTAMNSVGGGVYSAPVGGQSAGALVQFYVQATDGLGASTFFPPAGAASRAMIPWADARAQLTLPSGARPHNIRVVLPTADATELYKAENLMSDQAVPCTVILDEATAYYRAGVRLKSSEHGRISETRCGYTLQFPSDDLFLGIHDTIGVDRSGGTVTGQKEILLKRLENTAGGIYAPEDDICRLISAVGTVPTGKFTGSGMTGAAILSKTRLDKEFLDNQFTNGGDGSMHKYERVYVLTETINPTTRVIAAPAAGTVAVEYLKVPQDTTAPPGVNVVSLGANKEAYRWYWLLQNNREADDFSGIINVTNAIGQPGGSASFNSLVAQHVNVEAWLRGCIPATLYGVTDNYLGAGGNGQHNTLIYFPPGQKAILMPWDLDFLDQSNTSASLTARGDVDKFIANPVWKRLFYGHLQDILSRSFNSTYMTAWAQHYSRFGTDDMTSQVGTYLVPRANFAASQITAQIPSVSFARTSASPITVSTPFATVSGTGWVNVAEIRLQGTSQPLNVTWTGQSTWSLQLPISSGTKTYTLESYNYSGVLIGSVSVTVTGSGGVFLASPGDLAVTEVNYHPTNPTAAELAVDPTLSDSDFEFIELKSIATSAVDLNGLQVQVGATDTFRIGSTQVLQPGEYVIIAANPTAFAARYGSVPRVLGPYVGDLSNGGERLVILSAANAVIADFTYDDAWYPATDGGGRTLEGVDQGQLNFPAGWRASFRVHGTPGFEDFPPAISAGPDNATLNPGMPLNLSVTVTGSPTPTLQWRKNLVPIEGATAATFTIQSVTEGDEGNYDVVASSLAGQATSNPAIVSVNDPVVFSQHPQSKTVNSGTVVTFSVEVTGTGPFSYQWRKNAEPINGATASSLSMTATTADEGSYDVVVSNVVGAVTSNAATLSVNGPPQITASPQDKTVNPAAEVKFSVSVTGTGPFTYQWRKGGVPIPGAEGPELLIASATEGDEGSYDVVVANLSGASTSAPASLSVNDPVQITKQPKSRVVSPGLGATFSVTATGTGTLGYQWYLNDAPIAGATGPTHQVAAVATTDIGDYKVVITNVVGSVTSVSATLSLIDWTGTAGTFQGALARESASDAGLLYPGRVTLTVAKTGKFTGKLEHLGMSHSFKGQFDLDLHSEVAVKRGVEVPLDLVLDLSSEPREMTAEIAEPGVAEPAIAEVLQIPKRPRAQPAARAGRYTMHLKPGSQGPEDLKGFGFLAVNVSNSGAVSWVGKLQDDTRVNGSAKLSLQDSIAFYSRLYSTKALYAGHVAAPLSVTPSGVTGEEGWRKPSQPKGKFWRSGLVAILEVESSPWVAPRGVPVIAPGTKTFRFGSLAPSADEEYAVEFTAQGKFVVPLNSRKLKLSINRTTGVLTGSLLDNGLPRSFQGAMLQTQGVGRGFIPAAAGIQEWELFTPAP